MLITKAKVEAEEAQRLLLFALNGLAALHLLDKEPAQAIASYREVLFCLAYPLHLHMTMCIQLLVHREDEAGAGLSTRCN